MRKISGAFSGMFLTASMFLASSQSYAAGGTSPLDFVKTTVLADGGWISTVLTVCLWGVAIYVAIENFKNIVEQNGAMKSAFAICGAIALAVWWKNMASGILDIVTGM